MIGNLLRSIWRTGIGAPVVCSDLLRWIWRTGIGPAVVCPEWAVGAIIPYMWTVDGDATYEFSVTAEVVNCD